MPTKPTDPEPGSSSTAFGNVYLSSATSPNEPTIQPSHILNLNKNTRADIDGAKLRNEECHRRIPVTSSEPPSQANETLPSSSPIPKKRAAESTSSEAASMASFQERQRHWFEYVRLGRYEEKVIGGQSKEEELRVIWAEFDKKEQQENDEASERGPDRTLSGNDVLGAWEEEEDLYDLSEEDEGDW